MGLLYGVGCQAYAGGADVRAVKTLWEGIRDVPSLSRGEGQKGYVASAGGRGTGRRHRGPGPQDWRARRARRETAAPAPRPSSCCPCRPRRGSRCTGSPVLVYGTGAESDVELEFAVHLDGQSVGLTRIARPALSRAWEARTTPANTARSERIKTGWGMSVSTKVRLQAEDATKAATRSERALLLTPLEDCSRM